MSLPAEFPPIVADERGFVGRAMLDEVEELAARWAETERRLVTLAQDPQLRFLVGMGDAGAIGIRGRELLRGTQAELDLLVARTRAWADDAVVSRVVAGNDAAIASAVQQGASVSVAGALGVVNTQSINALIDDLMIDADFSASSSLQTMRRYIRRTQQGALDEAAINQSIIASEARLENVNQRAKRLEREFSEAVGGGNFIDIRGRRYRIEAYARLIARTRLAEAATQGAFNAITAMGIGLVRVSDHGKTDPVCDAHAGKVYSISGGDSRFPPLRERPPYHPNCRHALLPYVSELKTDRELEFAMARSRDRVEPGVSIVDYFASQ